ncbi:low temperature requirement A protein (LtrA) [Promicromonospora umidemergens]|uniref:Low temperature requirement A protein (LtrA) n=1 Tax=Promicromonospora umidemergens TaxID=629679 RepID=A0ABP8YFG3_9MICO|nr:low temperature requirement protein A [Promicromonospora umidemergens]MCP2286974.1 low temperature requirement A protein (LtrA) [Promicromonospora umidemergens]
MDVNASEPGTETDDRTTDPLELFFDLVFVFAMSQVTQLMLAEGTWLRLGRGALALGREERTGDSFGLGRECERLG